MTDHAPKSGRGTAADALRASTAVSPVHDIQTLALRYHQQSAEMAALQRQIFALARLRLEQAIADHPAGADLAIITDIDETVVDNSDLLVRDLQLRHSYMHWDTWKHWEREGRPRLIPGAREFLEFADGRGIAIFYVSDRFDENKAQTVAMLERLRLPQAGQDSVLLLGPTKQERRALVQGRYTVVLQLGDSLHDFSADFVSSVPLDQQHERVAEQAERFGRDWILLPNALYGTWHAADLRAWEAPIQTE
ncbi:MAG TPA: HAD family acid phosphatase [Paracoccus sp. (in: a-proteobacteria)]|nr:HAD family acid phosphatase [Paracoccus sp. (in: a-proteobacteria)]